MDNSHNGTGSSCGHEGCHMNHNMDNHENKGWEHKCDGGCMMCGMHGCHKHKFLRMLILIAIIFFTFWVGKQVGEFNGEFRNRSYDQDGYGMKYRMGIYDNQGMGRIINVKETMPCIKADSVSGTTATGQTWQQNMMKQAN